MSRLRPDALRVGLTPGRILLARYAWGLRYKLAEKQSLTFDPVGSAPNWRAALDALKQALPGCARGERITVVLSNHFVRYAILPWKGDLRGEAEWLEFARHALFSTYGDTVADWDIRVSAHRSGVPRVASAIDRALLPEIREACKAADCVLVSVQPYLMSACNRVRKDLGNGAAWFAVSEPGRLALGLIVDGVWQALRTRKNNGEDASLFETIRREAAMTGAADCERVVFLGEAECAPDSAKPYVIEDRTLRAGDPPDARPYAMVLA